MSTRNRSDPLFLGSGKTTRRKLGVPIAEAALQTSVARLAPSLLLEQPGPGTRVIIAPELELHFGRPDVVCAAVDVKAWHRRERLGIAVCTAPAPISVALALDTVGGRASLDVLVPSASIGSRDRVRAALSELVRRGWVERRNETYRLRARPGGALQTASAVEVKLNNWRRAVRQVQSWESHFDSTWLAFPKPYLRHVPRTAALRRFGLIAIDDDGASVTRRARPSVARGVRHVLVEELIYSRWRSTDAA